jgi:hypothetical protein
MIAGQKPRPRLLLLAAALLLAGCASPPGGNTAASQVGSRTRAELQDGDFFTVPPAGDELTDFGLSLVTNKGVRQGAPIRWIVITGIAPRSHAEMADLMRGDEIMAVDGVLLEELPRDALLRGLFGRQAGERIQLLVYKPAQTLPYFVELIAGRRAAN